MSGKQTIDTGNNFLVGALGDKIIAYRYISLANGITHDEALNLAAWLVALAYKATIDFDELLAAVKNS